MAIWKVKNGKVVVELKGAFDTELAFSPDGKTLAIANRKLSHYDVKTITLIHENVDLGHAVGYLPDHQMVSYSQRKLRICSPDGREIDPDGGCLVVGYYNNVVGAWRVVFRNVRPAGPVSEREPW